MAEPKTKCGFVSLIGAPNAGKSTLINTLVGAKVSIVSRRVQTTRTRVIGIRMEGESQMIFVDTPGIFTPQKRLERAMVSAAWTGAEDADVVALLVDAARKKSDADTLAIIERLKQQNRKALLILNKIDACPKDRLLVFADELFKTGVFTDVYMISALTGDGVDKLVRDIADKLPEGPWHYDPDQITDMPMRLLAAEITREKIFQRLYQELPYAVTVETETWDEKENGRVEIRQVIYVTRDSQKAIILGKGGKQIKALGTAARQELMEILETPVHLDLFVKVRDKWTEDPDRYRDWGLDFNA